MRARAHTSSPRHGGAARPSRPSRHRRHQRRRRRIRSLLALLGLALGVLGPATPSPAVPASARSLASPRARTPSSAPARLSFREPVDAQVTDGWRPPHAPYGPGNRGWQYGTVDGTAVHSAGAGTVTFAGQVGGVGAVTVSHRGGLRTSYTRLESIEVRAGAEVIIGERLGTAMTELHFGVRLRDEYVDPGLLFQPGALRYGARLRPP